MQDGQTYEVGRDVWKAPGWRGGPYKVVRYGGTGGQGEWGRALGADGKLVFLKEINFVAGADPEPVRKRFEDQQRQVFELVHGLAGKSFVCRPHHFFFAKTPRRWVQVFELYEGQDLESHFADATVKDEERIFFARMIADGMASLHEAGLALVDMKPANVFVQKTTNAAGQAIERPMVIDIAAAWKSEGGLRPMALFYTEEWSSPDIDYAVETLGSGQSIDQLPFFPGQPSDLFITARILFELFSGLPPFGDKAPDKRRAEPYRIRNGEAPRPLAGLSRVKLEPAQIDVIMRALAAQPGDRPTVRELHQALMPKPKGASLTSPAPPPSATAPKPAPQPAAQRITLTTGAGHVEVETGQQLILNRNTWSRLGQPWTENVGLVQRYDKLGWAMTINAGSGFRIEIDGREVPAGPPPKPLLPGKKVTVKHQNGQTIVLEIS